MAEIDFTPPAGFKIPANKKTGDTFESVARLRLEDGGKLCLEALDGVPVDPNPTDDNDGDEGGDFLSAVEKGAQPQPTTGGM